MNDWLEMFGPDRPPLPALDATRAANTPQVQSYFRHYGIDFEERYPGLRHFFGSFPSGDYQIAAHVFALPGATATAWIYHGYYDHVGLYRHLIDYCLSRGMSVAAYDMPGHGLSSGPRATIADFDEYRRVLRDAFAALQAFALPAPAHGFAQSTGAAVLMTHLLDGGAEDFDKVVLLAPLLRPVRGGWGRYLHALLEPFVEKIDRGRGRNSNDNAFIDFILHDDPLQYDFLPLQWVGAWKNWERRFASLPVSERPLLLIQGRADRSVSWRHNIPRIRRHFPAVRVHYLPRAHHHLVNESREIREQIWERIDRYLEED